MRILAVTAHPDDAEIFMGGSLLAWREVGAETFILIATDGRLGGKGDADALAAQRAKEAADGAAVLGAALSMLGLPDGSLTERLPEVTGLLGAAIRNIVPDLVMTHPVNDYHADHRALATAVLQAAGFRVPVAHCDPPSGLGVEPRYWIDIGPHAKDKARAILCHQTQQPARFVQRAETLSRLRAAQCGDDAGHAEALSFCPRYPFADIRALIPPSPRVTPVRDRRD